MAHYQTLLLPHALYHAGRKRDCFHDRRHHQILKGETVLQVVTAGLHTRGYCRVCALQMINQAIKNLEWLL